MYPLSDRIPPAIQPLLERYRAALTTLPQRFYGVYLYGSLALGGFDERTSDIDAVALTADPWTPGALDQLAALHAHLNVAFPLGQRLDAMYVPYADRGKMNTDLAPYPYTAEGAFHPAGHFDLNAVTWWEIAHNGIPLLGPDPAALGLPTTWADVLGAMRYNLDTYWSGQRAALILALTRTPPAEMPDDLLLFFVGTLCRILITIEEGTITTKAQAVRAWLPRVPAPFQPLLAETIRLQQHAADPTLYESRAARTQDVLQFLDYALERGTHSLDNSDLCPTR
jgi:hypothetical protein